MGYPFDFKFRPGEQIKTVDGELGWVISVIIDKRRSKPYKVETSSKKVKWFGEDELLEIK
jgi:hypothetical protein